jgi:serine/threonine protein kinase
MLYGTVPFKASNMTELQRQICKGSTSYKEEISAESINLVQGILEKDPKKRLSINEILRHPWMQNIPTNSNISFLTPYLCLLVNVFTDQEKDKVN